MHRFFCAILVSVLLTSFAANAENLPVRLHVIAENDTATAQALKLKVRDRVLMAATEITKDAENEQEAYMLLFTSIDTLRREGRAAARENGFDGDLQVEVTHETYPARLYGNVLLKEGEYPSVRVRIGNAEGKNWWCVLFPTLCLYGEKTDGNDIEFYSSIGMWVKTIFGR